MEVNRWWSKVMDSFLSFPFLLSHLPFLPPYKKVKHLWSWNRVSSEPEVNPSASSSTILLGKSTETNQLKRFSSSSQLFLSLSFFSPTSQLSFKEKSSLSLFSKKTTWNKSPSLMCDTKRDSMCVLKGCSEKNTINTHLGQQRVKREVIKKGERWMGRKNTWREREEREREKERRRLVTGETLYLGFRKETKKEQKILLVQKGCLGPGHGPMDQTKFPHWPIPKVKSTVSDTVRTLSERERKKERPGRVNVLCRLTLFLSHFSQTPFQYVSKVLSFLLLPFLTSEKGREERNWARKKRETQGEERVRGRERKRFDRSWRSQDPVFRIPSRL